MVNDGFALAGLVAFPRMDAASDDADTDYAPFSHTPWLSRISAEPLNCSITTLLAR